MSDAEDDVGPQRPVKSNDSKSSGSESYRYIIPKKLKLKGAPLKEVAQNGKKKIKKKRKHEEIGANDQQEEKHIVVAEKTKAEQMFENIMKEREAQQAKKLASKSYRERIEDFNKKIGSQSEHYDIPKVGPG